ncbi:glycosyltransferase family 39 protein [uncultured Bifidobacterium sp.]|uniref:glycosyltransferase family 39 protein n=1 Tax=uncultured Bifidobacterium sp. TaxID=165187 RepID=UPI0027DB39FA|nr:hypothetical protein [uncultured Bifidobacterium sp.]
MTFTKPQPSDKVYKTTPYIPRHANQRQSAATGAGNLVGIIFEQCILWLSALFLILIGGVTFIFSTHLLDSYEVTFSTTRWWLVSIGIAVAACCIAALSHTGLLEKYSPRNVLLGATAFSSLFCCGWIAFASVWPEWDPAYVFLGAQALADPTYQSQCPGTETDWVMCPGGYFDRFPYQIPLLAVTWLLVKVFGSGAYLAFQFLNVLCVLGTLAGLAYYTHVLFQTRKATNITILISCCFLPLFFYVTFAYGNTLCLPFLFVALAWQKQFCDTQRFRYIIGTGLFVLIALLLKSSMIYVMVAILAILVTYAMKHLNIKALLAVVIIIACYAGSGIITSGIAAGFGMSTDNGMPRTVWLAMGMQPQTNTQSNNFGWYNGYPTSWTPEEYDLQEISEDARQSIQDSIESFVNDPAYAAEYFGKKFVSEWTEPTYESLLASFWSSSGRDRPVMSQRSLTDVQRSVYAGRARTVIDILLDCLQTLIAAFAAFGLIRNHKQLHIEQLAGALVPLGVGILYLFWEAQSQYIMPAYLMMIPYAGLGLSSFAGIASGCFTKIRAKHQ